MYIVKMPRLIQSLFPLYNWKVNTQDKVLYLTFDDGPIPDVTNEVLDILNEYNAKATFFCVGENVSKNPHIFGRVIRNGHAVGSHTYNHLNGWSVDIEFYLNNMRQAATLIKSSLFRPPYGRIRPLQARAISKDFKIVMWDVLSGDFDAANTAEDCYHNVINNAIPGSIIVFHDSIKSRSNVLGALPQVLNYYTSLGYRFEALNAELFSSSGKNTVPSNAKMFNSMFM